jgi:hypothetical protein
MAKFKVGDRVVVVSEALYVLCGATGTVVTESTFPRIRLDGDRFLRYGAKETVLWMEDGLVCVSQDRLELIESPNHSAEPTQGAGSFLGFDKPDGTILIVDNEIYIRKDGAWIQSESEFAMGREWPKTEQNLAPQPNTLEWWRWHFAGQAMQGLLPAQYNGTSAYNQSSLPRESILTAEALISELQRKTHK